MDADNIVKLIFWIAASIGVSVTVTVFLIKNHAQGKHKDSVSMAMFEQYMEHAREFREEIRKDVRDIKQMLQRLP